MKPLWQTLIQPKMDYCSQLWCPGDQESILKLESVQRHFTSKVKGLENMSYWERLKALNLFSQERRRERYMIIFLWKISQNLVKGYSVPFTTSERRGRTIVPHQVVAKAPAAVRRARESSLSVKGARIFNLLPVTIRNIDSENILKLSWTSFSAWSQTSPLSQGMLEQPKQIVCCIKFTL